MSGVLDTKASDATLVDTTAKNNNNNSSSPLNSNSVTTTSASASEQIGTNYNHNQLSNLLPPHLEIDNITPASTFSASFDPHSNLPNSTESNTVEFTTPPAHPHSHPRATGVGHHPRESTASISTLNLQQAQEQWNQIVAESLAEIALQFEEASRRVGSQPLQLQPQDQDQGRGQGRAVPTDVSIHARLEGIEASQARFVQDLETVRLKLKGLADDNSSKGNGNGDLTTTTTGDTPSWKAKEKMREAFIGVEERFESADSVSVSGRVENLQRRTEGLESRMEVLEKSVEGILETIKLDSQQTRNQGTPNGKRETSRKLPRN
ncbi:hypothetical protein NLI96_g8206 [Meripilus lineatus]|uniref:Uncharacterized protein n=1 Tax=Meripilus lineatus TaxID=2056292 RepID=A0AAD5YGH9_9APHY|nr:hypothetical protein NLI96_g8206 [Physisporinus lineatus]